MTTITKQSLGALPCGADVALYTLKNAQGAYVEIATLGATIVSIHVPDKEGRLGDVTLGYRDMAGMSTAKGYMGKVVGRYANRIGGASFTLNGRTYQLAKNNGENTLHGGINGFDKKIYQAQVEGESLVLTAESPDGEENFPGAMRWQVTYSFSDANALRIQYRAECDQDTPVNLTNHVYFNLSGPGCPSACEHRMQIEADYITEVGSSACIPTGRLFPVEGTPLDLRAPRLVGEGLSQQETCEQMRFGNGYDHNFVVRGWDGTLRRIATLWDDASGRRMETWTDQPGVQFYSGNGIAGDLPGKLGVPYQKRQGLCLETQHFPDSVHHDNFPSCILKKGETFESRTEYRFFVE